MWLDLVIHWLEVIWWTSLCFKVNPNPLPCPSKHSLTCLCSPLQTHLRPPHPYLCPPDTDHSFRAADTTLPFLPSKLNSLCPGMLCSASVWLAPAHPSDLSLNVILSVSLSSLSPWNSLFLFLCFTATHILKRLFKLCLLVYYLLMMALRDLVCFACHHTPVVFQSLILIR